MNTEETAILIAKQVSINLIDMCFRFQHEIIVIIDNIRRQYCALYLG